MQWPTFMVTIVGVEGLASAKLLEKCGKNKSFAQLFALTQKNMVEW